MSGLSVNLNARVTFANELLDGKRKFDKCCAVSVLRNLDIEQNAGTFSQLANHLQGTPLSDFSKLCTTVTED